MIYFGCNGEAGHYLFEEGGRRIWKADGLPEARDLDGSRLTLPQERVGDGAISYLPAPGVTILAWWGSPWDGRPGVNAAIIERGRHGVDWMWSEFQRRFPGIAGHLHQPRIMSATRGLMKPERETGERG